MRPHGSIFEWLKFSKAELEEIHTMQTAKRIIVAICLSAVMICMAANVKARADTIEAAEIVSANVPGADLTSIAYAYNNLTTQQKLIADYLMGAYNYAYLCARGFSFNIDQTESNMSAQLGAIGERIWQYATTAYGWKSRFNEVFRQYASSIIVYASKIDVTFATWIDDILSGTRKVYIEYSAEAFDAWTDFYNDPSGDGIASFGSVASDWNSGTVYDFTWVGDHWNSANDNNRYSNFILENSPVLYTNIYRYDAETEKQLVFGFRDSRVVDSVFIQRGSSYRYFRYGYSDITPIQQGTSFNYCELTRKDRTQFLGYYSLSASVSTTSNIRFGVQDYQATSLSSLIEYAFDITTFSYTPGYHGYYYLFDHVFLVDDINTLSNPEEIQNVQDFDIVAPGIADFIITPNGKMLIPGYAPMTDPFAELWDISVDVENNTVSEDDYNTQIVNNTVINNYVVDASDKINVPVDWFDNELSDQLANDSIPFLSFARDCIDTLGELQIYFYGAIVFGLAGGVLKKLLL